MSDDFTIDEFLDGYEAPLVEAKVCMKANLVAEHAKLDLALHAAREAAGDVMRDAEVSRLRREVADLEQRMAESERTFWFRPIGHLGWQNLKRKFPPSKEQRADGLDIDVQAFIVPSIAASAAKPEMTLEQATALATKLPDGEVQKLFRAVLQANAEETVLPKSLLAAVIGRATQSGRSSTTAAPEASPAAGSSAPSDDQSPTTSTTPPAD